MITQDTLKNAAAVIPAAKGIPPIVVAVSTISSQSRLQMISHWHDEVEFTYVLDGKMDIHIEGEIITVSPGDFLVLQASVMHRSVPHNKDDCRFIRALIHPSLLTENLAVRNKLLTPLLGNTSRRYFHIPASSPDASRLAALLQEINKTNEKHLPGFELESIGLLHILLSRLYALFPPENRPSEEMPGADIQAQRHMIAYISKHYPEKISLAHIAAAGSVSRSKCCQLFKKYMQQSPIDFLNHYRLEISRNLLTSTESSILEIANACGFSSQSYYTKFFSEQFHLTPTQYRKEKRQS